MKRFDIDTFELVQLIFQGARRSAVRLTTTVRGPYVLSGLVHCGACNRRMQGSWNHGQPYYRCTFPTEYAVAAEQHAKTIYVKEASIVPALDSWLGELFTDEHLDSTCAALAASSGPRPEDEAHDRATRRKIKECDNMFANYRKALDAGGDPTVISNWIAEIQLERKAAELDLRRKHGDGRMTRDEIRSLVEQLKG
jgi:hypothetical protein